MGAQRVWLMCGGKYDRERKLIALLPVGSVERHGDHLPLGTDTMEAEAVASLVSEKLGAHLFPPIWYGSSPTFRKFAGTVDVGSEALREYVKGVIGGILRNGYEVVVVVNGHGGNSYTLREVARELAYEHRGKVIVVVDWWRDVAQGVRNELFEAPGHAGEDETSVMLHLAPNHVEMDLARDHVLDLPAKVSVFSSLEDEIVYPNAVLGRATRASAEKGKKLLEAVAEEIAEEVRKVLNILGRR